MDENETPEDRLEQALERIAKVVAARPTPAGTGHDIDGSETLGLDGLAAEVATRLDRIIDTLRQALGEAPGT